MTVARKSRWNVEGEVLHNLDTFVVHIVCIILDRLIHTHVAIHRAPSQALPPNDDDPAHNITGCIAIRLHLSRAGLYLGDGQDGPLGQSHWHRLLNGRPTCPPAESREAGATGLHVRVDEPGRQIAEGPG